MNVNEINITPNQELLDKVKSIELALWEKANKFAWQVDGRIFHGVLPISDITVTWRVSDHKLKAYVEVRFLGSRFPTRKYGFPLCTDLDRMWDTILDRYKTFAYEDGIEPSQLGVKDGE